MKFYEKAVDVTTENERILKDGLRTKKQKISIEINLNPDSEKKMLLTKIQIKKLQKGPGIIFLTKTQLMQNSRMSGSFIFTLLASLGLSLATGLVSGLVERAVGGSINKPKNCRKEGDGMYLKRNGELAKVTISGEGFFLRPTKRNIPKNFKDGVYLFKGRHAYSPTEFSNFKILH